MRLNTDVLEKIVPRARARLYPDDAMPNLMFQVLPNGTRNWLLRLNLPMGETHVELGGYPRLGLPKARKMAKRLQADHGINSDIEDKSLAYWKPKNRLERLHVTPSKPEYISCKKAEFRPHPMFQKPQTRFENAQSLRSSKDKAALREAEASAKREVAAAWESYQAEGDLEHIITVLTSAAAHYAPLGAEFAQEIARLLGKQREFVDPHDTRTDDRIFMMYWRQTEFLTGTQAVVLDQQAVDQCVQKLSDYGVPLSFDAVSAKITHGYAKWRQDHANQLAQSKALLQKIGEDIDTKT